MKALYWLGFQLRRMGWAWQRRLDWPKPMPKGWVFYGEPSQRETAEAMLRT